MPSFQTASRLRLMPASRCSLIPLVIRQSHPGLLITLGCNSNCDVVPAAFPSSLIFPHVKDGKGYWWKTFTLALAEHMLNARHGDRFTHKISFRSHSTRGRVSPSRPSRSHHRQALV